MSACHTANYTVVRGGPPHAAVFLTEGVGPTHLEGVRTGEVDQFAHQHARVPLCVLQPRAMQLQQQQQQRSVRCQIRE